MIVVRVLRKLAQTGRAIICTIHQPSKEIFNCFDSLLLLKKGAYAVWSVCDINDPGLLTPHTTTRPSNRRQPQAG